MHALLQVVIKEFLQLRHDRKMIPVMFIGPVVQLLALGYAANLDVTRIPLLLVDQDRSAESRALADRFLASGHFELEGTEDTTRTVEPWLVEGRAQIGLVIAPGYGEDLAAGRPPGVQVLVDGTDANSAVVGLGYASRILSGLVSERLQDRIEREPGSNSPGRIELVPRVWYNPDLRSRWFYVPAVLAMVLMLVTMMLPSMAVVREKEIGTLEQVAVTPLRPWQFIVGKLLPFVIIGIIDMLLITGLAIAIFGVPLRGSLALLTLLTFLFLLNTLGLGLLVSTLVSTQQQAMMFSAFVLMAPMIYLSGLIFPIENMPAGIQVATFAVPLRYYADVIRGVFLKGSGMGALWPDALAMLGMGLGLLALASLRFRKGLD